MSLMMGEHSVRAAAAEPHLAMECEALPRAEVPRAARGTRGTDPRVSIRSYTAHCSLKHGCTQARFRKTFLSDGMLQHNIL